MSGLAVDVHEETKHAEPKRPGGVPVVLVIAAILLVAGSVGLRIWANVLKDRIQQGTSALMLQRGQADQLNKELLLVQARHESASKVVTRSVRVGQYPQFYCDTHSLIPRCTVHWKSVVTNVPVASSEGQAQTEQQEIRDLTQRITQVTSSISAISAELERLNGRRTTVQDIAFMDKDTWRGAVTGLITLSALYVLLSRRYSREAEKWAAVALGTVLGYFLG